MNWRHWPVVTSLTCGVLAIGACSDGYSTSDGPLILTYGMSREATLQAMNTIGGHDYLEDRWRYGLDEGCRLQIESRALPGENTELAVMDAHMQATVINEHEPDSHTVFAHAPGAVPASGTLALDGANWSDAMQMKWLIDYLPVVCAAPQGLVR